MPFRKHHLIPTVILVIVLGANFLSVRPVHADGENPPEPPTFVAVTNGNGHLGDGELYGYLAEYDTPGELVDACRKVRDAGYTEFDAYSPFPVHGIDGAMGIKRTILPILVFGGGFTGAVGGMLL